MLAVQTKFSLHVVRVLNIGESTCHIELFVSQSRICKSMIMYMIYNVMNVYLHKL